MIFLDIVINLSLLVAFSERKLAERKLLEKVEELQHFRDMVVDRELVMLELKKEVNDLPRQLGQPEKYRIVA